MTSFVRRVRVPPREIHLVAGKPSRRIRYGVDNKRAVVGMLGPAGPEGPQGPAGPSGGASLDLIASGAIGGHRVCHIQSDGKVEYATNADPTHAFLSVGVSVNAGNDGDTISVITNGTIDEPSWSWTPQASLFLGTNGLLTQTCPSAPAFARIVANAISATLIYVNPSIPIFQN